jgi:hypothetical protein
MVLTLVKKKLILNIVYVLRRSKPNEMVNLSKGDLRFLHLTVIKFSKKGGDVFSHMFNHFQSHLVIESEHVFPPSQSQFLNQIIIFFLNECFEQRITAPGGRQSHWGPVVHDEVPDVHSVLKHIVKQILVVSLSKQMNYVL